MGNQTPRVLILKNEDPYDHLPWLNACKNFYEFIIYDVVDITKKDWLEQIVAFEPDVCVLKPSGKTSIYRLLYQERVEILVKDLGIKVYPNYDELRIYENKRYFSYWASANEVPHPKTFVFYHKDEAINFSKKTNYPVVGKLNIGASGNGVRVLKTKENLHAYIEKAFNEGLSSRTGPKLDKGHILKRVVNKLLHPKSLINKLNTYKNILSDKQKGFVILQEYITHSYEWRVVRIGDSFFAHKKLVTKEKASGTLLKGYENPPLEIFDYVKELTDRFHFRSVAVDLFEPELNTYLINEIQCIFGQSDPYQMLVDRKPGRYRNFDGQWIFEEGDFNQNQSYNVRLENILSSL